MNIFRIKFLRISGCTAPGGHPPIFKGSMHSSTMTCRVRRFAGSVRLRTAAVVATLLLVPGAVSAAVRSFSIQELNAEAARVVGADIRVEGRIAVYGKTELRFKNCELRFVSETPLPLMNNRLPNLEVTGQIVREEGRLIFRMRDLREVPADKDVLRQKRRDIRNSDDPEKWYALGKWADGRGLFYKDQLLLEGAAEAFQHGLELEHRSARDSPAALKRMLETDRGFPLPEEFRQQLIHETFVLAWKGTRKDSGETLRSLADSLGRELPGATAPAELVDLELRKRYFADPLAVYKAADAAARRKIHRLLYADVLLRVVSGQLAPDGSNGFEIADQLDRLLPEEHTRAESLRDRALAARAQEIGKLSRSDLLALAQQYRDRLQIKQADQVIESWLTLRRRRLDADDVEGLLQLSEEYRLLLNRSDAADRLLMDVSRRHPEAAEVAGRLQKAGYRLHDGQWLTQEQFAARPEGRVEQAIREGRIEPGMTAGQVRRALGEPLSLARAITAGVVTEVWSYGQPDTSRLVVRLVRKRRQTEATVVDVGQAR